MEILEILENPGVAVRVCGIYNKLLVVVKFFGDYISDRSIKLYEKVSCFSVYICISIFS